MEPPLETRDALISRCLISSIAESRSVALRAGYSVTCGSEGKTSNDFPSSRLYRHRRCHFLPEISPSSFSLPPMTRVPVQLSLLTRLVSGLDRA